MKTQSFILSLAVVTLLSACKEPEPKVANITLVDAVTKTEKVPHQVCRNVAVTNQLPPSDDKKIIGTIVGGAAGAALGNQIGGGSGKTIATATGSVAGALIGRDIQDDMQQNKTVTTYQNKCHTEYTTSSHVVGYDVTYDLAGASTTVRLDKKPAGNTFPVVEGKVVLPQ